MFDTLGDGVLLPACAHSLYSQAWTRPLALSAAVSNIMCPH